MKKDNLERIRYKKLTRSQKDGDTLYLMSQGHPYEDAKEVVEKRKVPNKNSYGFQTTSKIFQAPVQVRT